MDLLIIFQILFRRIWLLLASSTLAAVAAFLYTSDYQKSYKSTAQLATGFTISEAVKITDERLNYYEVDIKFNNLIETINSPRVLSLLSYKLLIHDLKNPKTSFRDISKPLKENPDLANINFREVYELIQNKLDSMSTLYSYVALNRTAENLLEAYEYDIESIRKNLQISRVKNTDYISVVGYTEDPYLSAFMVNTLCDEFLRYHASITNSRFNESIRVFAKLVTQKKKELDDISEKLRQFKSSNSLLNFSAETENKISQISDLEIKLEEERSRLRSITLTLTDINRRVRNTNNSGQSSVNSNIVELRRRINALNQQYIEDEANNQDLLDSLNRLRKVHRFLISKATENTRTQEDIGLLNTKKSELEVEKKIAEQNIRAMQTNLYRLQKNSGGYASKEAEIAALERELYLAAEEYKNAQEKYNNSLDIANASGNTIQQILIGQPASEPEPSKRIIISGLSGMSTLVFCVLIIIFLEYIDVSLKSSSNFSSVIPLNLIGVLNHINLEKISIINLFKNSREYLDNNSNTFRESLRKLRFQIEKLDHKVYLITSTKPGEGKTTVINALSMALSLTGSRILLIDTNFSNNSLTQEYTASSSLERLLTDKNLCLQKAILKTKISNIDIIGCKGGNYSPTEISKPERLASIISALRENYDYIFLEGAALNLYSDSRELSEYVEGVVTIFAAVSTIKQTDKESISFIQNLGAKNIGAVLNDVEIENMET